jgi:hypothetical protein
MQATYRCLEATAGMQQSAHESDCSWCRLLIYSAVMYGAEVWGIRRRQSGPKISAVVSSPPSVLAPASH